jgi:hypothetical protein
MDAFTKLFGGLLLFFYHCFDRIVIHGYLSGRSRPEQVVHFFRQVVGVTAVDKELLSRRPANYQNWVEAFAHNHGLPIEWAEKGVRAISQIEYCRNFIFKCHFPIHKLFERACELGLWRLTADKMAAIFGTRLTRRHRGKLASVINRIEHGHHIYRAYFKNAFLKQYEKFATFLRNELCSNNLAYFGLRKGLDHRDAVRSTFLAITDRFAGFQAQWLNVPVDFPLLQRIALPITVGAVRYPGIKIHDVRVIRLLEVLLHGGTQIGDWTAKEIHQAVLTTFKLSERAYGLNQLRYDLRKRKGHGLIERDGSRYAYRLTSKGVQVALLFLLFHKRLCGPLANSRFHHRPDPHHRPDSRLEAAYHRGDKAIEHIVELLAAA